MSLYKKEHPEYLRLALDSMINQTEKPDEIVLVEDGPLTDELYTVVKAYKEKYPCLLHIVKNKKNLGLGLALNVGLKACRNEFVALSGVHSTLDSSPWPIRFIQNIGEFWPETTISDAPSPSMSQQKVCVLISDAKRASVV